MNKVQLTAIQNFIKEKKPAFLFGNGINLYNDSNSKTWREILQDLLIDKIKDDCDLKFKFERAFESDFSKDISYPEMYDLINGLYKIFGDDSDGELDCLQKEACDIIEGNFRKNKKNKHYKKIVEKLRNLNLPLMTTNFDNLFEKYSGLDKQNMKSLDQSVVGSGKYSAHFAYQWNKYFSDNTLTKPDEKFAIWHIHGTIYDSRSIQLGTNQYVGMLDRARFAIRGKKGAALSKSKEEWFADNTWLDLMYNRPLVVIGLGVSTDEIFLRWLLLGRNRHLTDFSNKVDRDEKHSLYLSSSEHPVPYAQRLFLETCGFEIIELSTDKELYEDLWNY